MGIHEQIAQRIIQEQELIIGPLARAEAGRVPGIVFDEDKKNITLNGDKLNLIDKLVARYESLFGQASVRVCHDAASSFLPELKPEEIPSSLK